MTDLVQEFFRRDLSEAEHEALAKLLEDSPEAALEYERRLGQYYLATGLPQPTLPQGLRSLPKPGSGWAAGKGALLVLSAGLVLAGLALWRSWPRHRPEAPLTVAQPAAHPKAPGMRRPVRAAEASQEGQELSVVLDAPRKSLVTVRILGPGGREVRDLYTGFVDPGRWSFQWDGLVEDGEPAAPGDYLIDVQSGESHQAKSIHIHVRPAAP